MRGEWTVLIYKIGFAIVGASAFVFSWVYTVQEHGWVAGVLLGWIPALIIGMFAGAIWPVTLAVIVALGFAI